MVKANVNLADHCWQVGIANWEPKLLKREGPIGCMHLILTHSKISCLNSIAAIKSEMGKDLTELEIQELWLQGESF